MRKSNIDISIFKNRRAELAKKIPGGALIVCAHPEAVRNNDTHFPYRQDSNLFYLTGFEEPDSVLVFRPGQSPETVLFVRPKDPLRETWDGFRFGPEGAEKEFGIDKCFVTSELQKQLPELLKPADRLYFRLRKNPEFDRQLEDALENVRSSFGRSGRGLLPLIDSTEILGELRVIKSQAEVDWLLKACEITGEAHVNAMRFTRPGVTERQVESVLHHTFMYRGSPRVGYNPIVATGNNAVTLHYVFNDQVCKDGDLLLIDAGTEWNYLSSDITRCFPVSGRFSQSQRDLYQAVLAAQKSLVQMVKPGLPFKELQAAAIDKLTEVMLELGLVKGTKDKVINNNEYKKYYPHNVSHWLGMDVHDAGLYTIDNKARTLEPGMVLTIEPGIYVREDDMDAPKEFRGIGIRIEDDVLVSEEGRKVLTESCPKEISEIENLVGRGYSLS